MQNLYPFIHRFQTKNNNYVYDVHTGEIIRVSKVIFEIIELYNENCEKSIIEDLSNQFDAETLENAFVSIRKSREKYNIFRSDRPKHEILVPHLKALKERIDTNLQVLTLGITERCNLNCCYCIYSGRYKERRVHSKKVMDFSTAKKAVDYLKRHNRPEINPPGIGFYGGEPLLRFPFVRDVTEYAKHIFSKDTLGFTITTNGTQLTNEMLDFFEENAFYLVISLDGPQEYHDRSRKFRNGKGSWNRVIKNLEKIKEVYPKIFQHRLMLSTTISSPANYKELDKFFSTIGVNQHIGLVEAATPNDYIQFGHLAGYEYVLEKFRDSCILGRISDKLNHPEVSFVFNLFDEAITKLHKRNNRPIRLDMPSNHGLCIPGGFKLFVGADGSLFPCEKLEGYSGMRIGHIDQGIDINSVKILFDDFIKLKWQCEDCWILRFCPCCFVHPLSEGKFNNKKLELMCNIWRNHYHRMIETYCSILELNENAFECVDNKNTSLFPESINT